LGLPISKQLIEQQGGTITVKSQLNSGSVFSFVLPFKKISTQQLAETNSSQLKQEIPVADLQGLKVLVVDDTKINQQVAALTLQKWNAQVLIANSAKEAFDILSNEIIQVVLMDVTMPEMDGYETTKYIRTNFREPTCKVPIIAITAAAFVGDREKCLAAGMNDYISKPFNPELLLKAIVNLIPTAQLNHQENTLSDLSLLYERAAGDNQFIKEMLECYIQELPLYVAEMELFLEQKDWKEVSKQAHKMKSPIALIGATKLQEAYTNIELGILSQDNHHVVLQEIHRAQKQCLDLVEELKTELQKFIA
jgi:CheY-like chemotaxis protein/HPt (histidine-containing phosphotransfer) domain-containing protein